MTRRPRDAHDQTDGGQLRLPLVKPRIDGRDGEALTLGSRTVVVRFVRHPRARRYVLRVLPDGTLRVTVPRGGNRAEAVAFLRRHARWIEGQRYVAARADAAMRVHGDVRPLRLERDANGDVVWLGAERVAMRRGETPRAAVCRHLRTAARRELIPRLRELAAQHGVTVGPVSIRGQRTRWGSCSPAGAISLNWRLVQMPDGVRDYVLIHELMHLREASHARRFWRLVEGACPGHRDARRWLKEHGEELL